MLTISDVARHWALTEDTVRRHIRSGNLPAQRLHR
ncbi:MAG: DNA-binding protein, partial [Alphaproteobacteria bacterium]